MVKINHHTVHLQGLIIIIFFFNFFNYLKLIGCLVDKKSSLRCQIFQLKKSAISTVTLVQIFLFLGHVTCWISFQFYLNLYVHVSILNDFIHLLNMINCSQYCTRVKKKSRIKPFHTHQPLTKHLKTCSRIQFFNV